jgi:hypothetical protein
MNNKFNIFIIGLLIISLFSPAVSAAVVLTSYWESNSGDYIEIEKGDSEQFFMGTSSTTYHINYEIELYRGSQLVDTLYEGSHNGYFYNDYFELDSSNLEIGNYKVRIKVNDGGQGYDWDDLYFEVYEEIVEENNAPEAPYNPSPYSGEDEVNLNVRLDWDAYDQDGDELTFDVYFKEEGESYELIANDITKEYLYVNGLDYETNYFWKVVASDDEYSTSGPIWTFETEEEEIVEENHAPTINLLNPSNGEDDLDLSLTLRWNGYDVDGDDLEYNVYLGERLSGVYEVLATGIDREYFHVNGLDYETEYSWFITVNDGEYFVDSLIWNFETKEEIIIEENHPPEEPYNPSPYNGEDEVNLNVMLDWDAYDQDGDDLSYEVYFGVKDSGIYEILSTDLDVSYIQVNNLDYETEYEWFVVVKDYEFRVYGPHWTFETEEEEIVEENHAPVIEEIGNKKVKCGRRFTLDVDAYDQDGDELTFSDNTDLFEIDDETGEISFRTDCDDKGNYNIRITVKDEHGAKDYEYFTLRIYKDDCDDDDEDNDDPQFHEFIETSQCIDDADGDSYGIRTIIYSIVDLVSGQEYSNETREEVCLLTGSQQIYKNDTSGLIMLFVALLFLLITIPIAFFIFKKLS